MSAKISVVKGDITKLSVDAIVNAANNQLAGGGGVDGAIHLAGGPAIMEECKKIRKGKGGCPTGEAVITTSGNLPCKYVIHAVGPVWENGSNQERQYLANAYRYALFLAIENNIHTIAFPNISTGVYDFPKKEAATIAINEVKKFIERNQSIEEVIFVCFDQQNFDIYNELLP